MTFVGRIFPHEDDNGGPSVKTRFGLHYYRCYVGSTQSLEYYNHLMSSTKDRNCRAAALRSLFLTLLDSGSGGGFFG